MHELQLLYPHSSWLVNVTKGKQQETKDILCNTDHHAHYTLNGDPPPRPPSQAVHDNVCMGSK